MKSIEYFLFKIVLPLFLIIFSFNFTLASSPQPRFSLITIGQGNELYSTFGHSAIRYYDPDSGIDKIYNYGTFNFNDPDFYLKFVQGKLNYMLSVSSFDLLLKSAKRENRSVFEQVLALESDEVEKLYQFLEINYLPENRYYRYDFFFDNCSTRIRDALAVLFGERIKFNFQPEQNKSFRQLIDEFLTTKRFQDLGMDIGLGAPADRLATAYDYMFLPEYLMQSVDVTTIVKNGTEQPLLAAFHVHYVAKPIAPAGFTLTPAHITWILFFVVLFISIKNLSSTKTLTSGDLVLFVTTGLLGIILLLLWFATDHYVTAYNWDLIWAMPLNVLVVVFIKNKVILRNYLMFYCAALILFVLALPFIPQEINHAVIPVILLLIMRSGVIVYKLNKHYLKETLNNRRSEKSLAN